ncbi:MAG: hypothetical protein IPG86_19885 [Chitinophagaceae bacterium]|nr:hypothetical protein [Chitinophagaceae bacterium]
MIQVDNIHITVPGLSESQAASFGKQVAERMAVHLAETANEGSSVVNQLNLRVTMPEGMGHEEMADHIAMKLVQQLSMK